MKKILILFCLIVSFQSSKAFDIKVDFDTTAVRDTITFEQFGMILYAYKGGSVTLSDIIVIEGNYDYESDTILGYMSPMNLELNLRFENVWFKDPFYFGAKIKSYSAINSNLSLDISQSTNQIELKNCLLNNDFVISIADNKKISSVRIENSIIASNYVMALGMDGNWFYGSKDASLYLKKVKFISDNDSCWIKIGSKVPSVVDVYIGVGNKSFNEVIIDSSIFDIDVSFEQVSIAKNFSITNTVFERGVGFSKVLFPNVYNVNIKWTQLKESLALINRKWVLKRNDFGEFMGPMPLTGFHYDAGSTELVSKVQLYDQLVTVYNEFIQLYKNRGDLESKNECYKELKDLETRRLKYLYESDKNYTTFLNWQLNVFLKYFAEYGTSPIRSLVVSFWVVLLFALFYFFAETDWDNINRKYLMKQSESILEYFTSEQKLEDFYSKAYKEDLLEYNEFKAKIGESSSKVPFFFMLFLKPLYYMSIIKHKINSWLYRRMEILSGRWVDLSQSKKLMVGSVVAFSSVFYVFYLFVLRSLNSIMLSINTFSTLGFGDIPVKGFMRYVAIIEGFLGWFLLSIFSVSLISQILQS